MKVVCIANFPTLPRHTFSGALITGDQPKKGVTYTVTGTKDFGRGLGYFFSEIACWKDGTEPAAYGAQHFVTPEQYKAEFDIEAETPEQTPLSTPAPQMPAHHFAPSVGCAMLDSSRRSFFTPTANSNGSTNGTGVAALKLPRVRRGAGNLTNIFLSSEGNSLYTRQISRHGVSFMTSASRNRRSICVPRGNLLVPVFEAQESRVDNLKI